MTNADKQVIALYEDSGCTPEEIADIFEYEVTAVKMLLYAHVTEYREKCDAAVSNSGGSVVSLKQDEEVFTKDEVLNAKRTMAALVNEDTRPEVAFKAAKYVINESKGRNDLCGIKDAKQVNILIINQRAANARAALDRARRNVKIVDINSNSPQGGARTVEVSRDGDANSIGDNISNNGELSSVYPQLALELAS